MLVLSLSWSNDAFNVKTNQQCSFGDGFSNHYSTTDIRPKPVLAKRSDSLYNLVYSTTVRGSGQNVPQIYSVCVCFRTSHPAPGFGGGSRSCTARLLPA